MHLSCVILIQDPELLAYVRVLQILIKESAGSSFNMDNWVPHITIGHGINISEEQLTDLQEEIGGFLKNQPPLMLPVKGFCVMKKATTKPPYLPHVINISLEPTMQIRYLSKSICSILEKYPVNWSFSGENGIDFLRLTLASRDLTEKGAKWFAHYSKANSCLIKNILVGSVALVQFKEKSRVFYEQELRANI